MILNFICLFLIILSVISIAKSFLAHKSWQKLSTAIDNVEFIEDMIKAIDLADVDYAYSWRVQMDLTSWSAKSFYPEAFEFLESKGIEVK